MAAINDRLQAILFDVLYDQAHLGNTVFLTYVTPHHDRTAFRASRTRVIFSLKTLIRARYAATITGCVGIAHFRVALQRHCIADFGAVRICHEFPKTNRPGGCAGWQIDAVAALVTAGRLPADGGIDYLLENTAVCLQINGVVDAVTHQITVVFLVINRRPFQTQANCRKLRICECARPGC